MTSVPAFHGLVLGSAAPTATEDLARPIAGAPLLVRQLEWLARCGVTHVTVNRVATSPMPECLGAAALAQAGVRVTYIPTGAPLDAGELARRAGIVAGVPVCVLPHGRIGNTDLTAEGAVGWRLDACDEARAHALVEDLLLGTRSGIEIRGTQSAPGVFRARGARVHATSRLIPPCYLGAGCVVGADATIGPGAVLDEGAVVERDARVVHARVAKDVIVGQGIALERAVAAMGRIVRHAGRAVPLEDALLLGRRDIQARPSRMAAAAALSIVAPLAALGHHGAAILGRRLARVVRTRGSWLGVRDESDPDAVVIDVADRLVPAGAQQDERSAARAYYLRAKTVRLDLMLLAASAMALRSLAK